MSSLGVPRHCVDLTRCHFPAPKNLMKPLLLRSSTRLPSNRTIANRRLVSKIPSDGKGSYYGSYHCLDRHLSFVAWPCHQRWPLLALSRMVLAPASYLKTRLSTLAFLWFGPWIVLHAACVFVCWRNRGRSVWVSVSGCGVMGSSRRTCLWLVTVCVFLFPCSDAMYNWIFLFLLS